MPPCRARIHSQPWLFSVDDRSALALASFTFRTPRRLAATRERGGAFGVVTVREAFTGCEIKSDGVLLAPVPHRVRCDYDLVLANIKRFAQMRSDQGKATRIWVKFVRTQRNEHEVQAAFELFSGFMDSRLDRFQDALALDWSESPTTDADFYYRPKVMNGVRRNSCTYFDNVLEVTSDGKVAACCLDYNLTVSEGGLGDAREVSLFEIWRGEKRHRLGAAHLPGGQGLPEKCQTYVIMNEPEPISPELIRLEGRHLEGQSDTSLIFLFPERAAA